MHFFTELKKHDIQGGTEILQVHSRRIISRCLQDKMSCNVFGRALKFYIGTGNLNHCIYFVPSVPVIKHLKRSPIHNIKERLFKYTK